MSDRVEVPTISKFIEFVKEIEHICNEYRVSYEILQRTAELLDDFGWEAHPAMILNAMAGQYGHTSVETIPSSEQTKNEEEN